MGIIASIYNWYFSDEKASYYIIRTKSRGVEKITQTVSVDINGKKRTYNKITTINKDGLHNIDEVGDYTIKQHPITGGAISGEIY